MFMTYNETIKKNFVRWWGWECWLLLLWDGFDMPHYLHSFISVKKWEKHNQYIGCSASLSWIIPFISSKKVTSCTSQTQQEYIPRKGGVAIKENRLKNTTKIIDRLGSDLGGKIFVVDIPTAVDIATKKRGEDSIH